MPPDMIVCDAFSLGHYLIQAVLGTVTLPQLLGNDGYRNSIQGLSNGVGIEAVPTRTRGGFVI